MDVDALFQPFTLKAPAASLTLPNRIVMAPMTRAFSPGGMPTAAMPGYYQRRALGEVGLIITEGVGIDRPAARNEKDVPVFHGGAESIWRQVVEEVHAAGGLIAPQLWHVGSKRGKGADWAPLGPIDSPSGIDLPDEQLYQPLSEEGVADVLASYEKAARVSRELGFDAIEIHAAHGYLIDQFFWPGTNRRSDQWNGPSIGERARFGAEVVKAVRAGAGDTLPVIIRLSQWKLQDYNAKIATNPNELSQWLDPLAAAGADVFHCSQRRFWEPEFEGSELNFAGWAKRLTGKPSITVGSVGLDGEFIDGLRGASSKPASLDALLQRMDRQEFDLVAVGRALLADPYWTNKIKRGLSAELQNFQPADLATLS